MRHAATQALVWAMGFAALGARAEAQESVLRLATTTSTYESGLLDRILPPFEARQGTSVHVISVGTGKALEIARSGDVDIILVHARAAEDRFVSEGYGVNRRDVMYNDFLILGPQADPAGIGGMSDAARALGKVMAGEEAFVSRGDDSGTHKKERSLWEASGSSPEGAWYFEAGQGMSATLRMADEKDAYVMVDRATYLFHSGELRLRKMVEGDTLLLNPYGIIAVSPYRHAHVQYEQAMALIGWVTSPECQDLIGQFKIQGQQLFHPDGSS